MPEPITYTRKKDPLPTQDIICLTRYTESQLEDLHEYTEKTYDQIIAEAIDYAYMHILMESKNYAS